MWVGMGAEGIRYGRGLEEENVGRDAGIKKVLESVYKPSAVETS